MSMVFVCNFYVVSVKNCMNGHCYYDKDDAVSCPVKKDILNKQYGTGKTEPWFWKSKHNV